MTAVDQDEAAARFAHYIDRILRPYVPEASRWTLACQIVKAAREEHWRCLPPAPDPIEQARHANPAPPRRPWTISRLRPHSPKGPTLMSETTTTATLPELLTADLAPLLARVLPAENTPALVGAFNSAIAPYETPVAVVSLPGGQEG